MMKHFKNLICCFTAIAAGISIFSSSFMSGSSDTAVVHASDKVYKYIDGNGCCYEIWNWFDRGTADAEFDENGGFICSWNDVTDCFFSSGHNLVKTKQSKHYDEYDTLSLSYDVEFEPEGDSRLCVSGSTTDPLTLFFVIEAWNGQRPLEDSEPIASLTSDGKTYDIYHTTKYIPGLKPTAYELYWSVAGTNPAENNTKNDLSGTVTLTNHFNAWAEAGYEPGLTDEIALSVDAYASADNQASSGKATVKKNILTVSDNSLSDDDKIPSVTEPSSSPSPDTTDSETPDVSAPDEITAGDIDNNGTLNTADIIVLMQYLVGKTDFTADQKISADLNKDGKITVIDLIRLKNILI